MLLTDRTKYEEVKFIIEKRCIKIICFQNTPLLSSFFEERGSCEIKRLELERTSYLKT